MDEDEFISIRKTELQKLLRELSQLKRDLEMDISASKQKEEKLSPSS